MTERDNDASVSDIPWASVFDPAVNIRALSEIQARGFRAATEVVNQFIRMADTNSVSNPTDSDPAPGDQATPPPSVDRVLQVWQRLATQAVASLRDAAQPRSEVAAVDIQHATSSGAVSLAASEPGAVSTEVWLHNHGAEDLGKVRLRCSDLLAHDGALIESAMVRFEPDTVPMVARCSRGVTVEIDVPDDIAAGNYRGTMLADGYPDIWLPVVLSVLPRSS
ncbi:MAG: hypothetical protein WB785_02895 [Mycobacterium sp.]|uniref:hypothetical protein n=1 Tax=Mycobacterium sp. TaxID=1785 RepID=UPI003C5A1146